MDSAACRRHLCRFMELIDGLKQSAGTLMGQPRRECSPPLRARSPPTNQIRRHNRDMIAAGLACEVKHDELSWNTVFSYCKPWYEWVKFFENQRLLRKTGFLTQLF